MDQRKRQGLRLATARRAAGYRSSRDAALSNKWPESSYRAHENGSRTIGQDDAERYAKRFRAAGVQITGRAILYGDDEVVPVELDAPSNIVRVAGKIGAGAEILPEVEQVPPEGLAEIELPFPVLRETIAFQVEGDSMWPAYFDGDVILCGRRILSPADVLNQEAAVCTNEGRRYLKRVLKGSAKDTYDLESHNAPPIRGVRLEWAAEVDLIVRRGKWRVIQRAAQS